MPGGDRFSPIVSTGCTTKSSSSFAQDVGVGRLIEAVAVEKECGPDSIDGACRMCNSEKGAGGLSKEPWDGCYVPKKIGKTSG